MADQQDKDRSDPYRPWWHRLPLVVLLLILFAVGAYRVAVTDNGLDGIVMLTIATLLIGVWITVELHDRFYGEHRRDRRDNE